jgi:hypothetical protein
MFQDADYPERPKTDNKDVDYPERPRGFTPRENDWFRVAPFKGYWLVTDEDGKEGLPVIEHLGRWLVGEDEFKSFRPAACWALRNACSH